VTHILPRKMFDIYYGLPATGKSEAAAAILRQMHKESGKRARVVVGDGSMLTYQYLVEAGVVDIMEFSSRPWPLDTMQKLVRGWWPEHSDDPESPLKPPTPADVKELNGYVFEGISVACNYIMGNVEGGLAERSGRGEKIGQDSPIRIIEGHLDPKTGVLIPGSGPGTTFGGNPVAHYGVAQGHITGIVQQSRGLPVQVTIWTAHESVNDPEKDALVKELVGGPEVVGKALTTKIQRLFNNMPHFQSVGVRTKVDDDHTKRKVDELDLEYRVYTRDHYNANGAINMRYKACTRAVSEDFPQFFVGKSPGDNIIAYYTAVQEECQRKALDITGTSVV